MDERVNGTLARILRTYEDEYQEHWDDQLKWAVYIYNTTVHGSTGYSPYQMLHEFEPRSPLKPLLPCNESLTATPTQSVEQIRETASRNIKRAQEEQKKYYDRHRSEMKLYLGQLVYIKIPVPPRHLSKKLYFRWDGPCVIIGFVGDHANPKAVQILDWENMIKKVVAITDVKPLINTYQRPAESREPETQTQKGGGHTLDVSDSLDWRSPAYYYAPDTPPQQSATESQTTQIEHEDEVPLINLDDPPVAGGMPADKPSDSETTQIDADRS